MFNLFHTIVAKAINQVRILVAKYNILAQEVNDFFPAADHCLQTMQYALAADRLVG
jgi:hypothetical protein